MFFEFIFLGIDFIIVSSFIKLYQRTIKNIEELQNAPRLELDSNLHKTLSDSGGSLPYAVVTGTVRAKNNLISSIYVPSLYGVIQEVVVKEHKTQWSPWSRFWCDVEHELKKSLEMVPFSLTGTHRYSWWRTAVEVMDVGQVNDLPLTVVHDHFAPCSDTLGTFLMGWVRGERCRGIQEVERMLKEGVMLTGIGEVVLADGQMQLQAPPQLAYFLTTLSPEEITQQLQRQARSLKISSLVFGFLGLFLAACCFNAWRQRRKKELEKQEAQRRLNEVRRQRRQAQREARERGEAPSVNQPQCVVCLSNPVELLVLECGHACLCGECGDNIRDICPMCRGAITRIVPAFLP